jgi:hypothetical protein
MMKTYRWLLAFSFLFLVQGSAFAQWQAPSHSVPVGRGAGVTGFGFVGPCAVGVPIVGAGPSSDPVCGVSSQPSRIVTASAPVTVTSSDYLVIIRQTTGAPINVALPVGTLNQTVIIKDGKGDAYANPITIIPTTATIDGAGTYVISVAYGAVTLTFDGTQWNIL